MIVNGLMECVCCADRTVEEGRFTSGCWGAGEATAAVERWWRRCVSAVLWYWQRSQTAGLYPAHSLTHSLCDCGSVPRSLTHSVSVWLPLECAGSVWLLSAEFADSALSKLTDNSESCRRQKIDMCKRNRCHRLQTFSDDYSQEFVIYNETGIDVSLIVAYHHKFHHQTKKTTVYRLLVCSSSLASITDIMSIFRRQQRFFLLFFARHREVIAWYFNSQISCFADLA